MTCTTLHERLEDLRTPWQAACGPAIDEAASRIAEQATNRLAPSSDEAASPTPPELSPAVDPLVRDWAEGVLLPTCLRWLKDTNRWPGDDRRDDAVVHDEMAAALQHLPTFPGSIPPPSLTLPLRAWAMAAAIGAGTGMLLLTPVSLVLLGQREIGLFAGGIAGATTLVVVLGILAGTPAVRSALGTALTVSSAGSLLAALVSHWRSRPGVGWFRAALVTLASAFVTLLARPRVERLRRVDLVRELQHRLPGHLRHVADLVLSWCWVHPARESGAQSSSPPFPAPQIPSGVCLALAELHRALATAAGRSQVLMIAKPRVQIRRRAARTRGGHHPLGRGLVNSGMMGDPRLTARPNIVLPSRMTACCPLADLMS
jgi:hypothetical protein